MPDTFTPNLNLTQPQVGADNDVWGTKLNADLTIIDALFAASGAGTVVTRDASGYTESGPGVVMANAAGTIAAVQYKTAAAQRWTLGTDGSAETGSNAGTNLVLNSYTDAGAALATVFGINRATGVASFAVDPTVGANSILHTGNVQPLLCDPGVGEIRMWDGTADPVLPGGSTAVWMIADGRAISRTTYAAYFALVGTRYGTGNGTTTFNIRNMVGRTPVGVDAAGSTTPNVASIGATTGEAAHTLTVAEAPTGQHTLNFNDPGHTHTLNNATNIMNNNGGLYAFSGTNVPANVANITANTNTTGITASLTDHAGGGAHNNVQPSSAVYFIVRVA